jgi:CO/xanthine dehydrogenase FAD-binding subunit
LGTNSERDTIALDVNGQRHRVEVPHHWSLLRATLGGVAPLPFRCVAVEEALRGVPVAAVDLTAVGNLAVRDGRPLKDNGFEVALASSLVRRGQASLLRLDA